MNFFDLKELNILKKYILYYKKYIRNHYKKQTIQYETVKINKENLLNFVKIISKKTSFNENLVLESILYYTTVKSLKKEKTYLQINDIVELIEKLKNLKNIDKEILYISKTKKYKFNKF